jgi:hydrogenase expression/formation protein HypC
MAHADFAGTVRRVCLAYLPGLCAGDYVISHMGYALTRLSEQDARQTIALMREHGIVEQDPARRQGGGSS